MALYSILPDRALISVSGPDRFAFLQGLISNDMRKVEHGQAIWAALLTPQGKFLHEFFVFSIEDRIFLDCECARRDDLKTRLSRYKLRSKVDLKSEDEYAPGAAWGQSVGTALNLSDQSTTAILDSGMTYRDPRLANAGARWALRTAAVDTAMASAGLSPSTPEKYDSHRLSLGLPDGSRDMEVEKTLLLESGFEELNGVDFQKGCYMGQEITARTHYRALIKKRLLPVDIDSPTLEPGTPLEFDGAIVGQMKSSRDHRGMALIKMDLWTKGGGGSLETKDTRVTPFVPDWMKLPNSTNIKASQ